MTPKILFLDIDGPMVSARSLLLPGNGFGQLGWKFDPCAVSMLNYIAWAIPELRVVLSSHRWGANIFSPQPQFPNINCVDFWKFHCESEGLRITFHEDWATPRTMDRGVYIKCTKAIEITRWLDVHPEVKVWTTLEDDLNSRTPVTDSQRSRFKLVGEDFDNGLTWSDFRNMCKHLGLSTSPDKYYEYSEDILAKVA